MRAIQKTTPEEYILAVLSTEDRLEAALGIAKASFRKTKLTAQDVKKAVKKVRRRVYEKGKK